VTPDRFTAAPTPKLHPLLLLEDNPADAYLVEEWIRDQATGGEFSVTHARRMSQAVELLKSTKFDLVVCDLGLPDSDNLDTLSQIKEFSSAPLIVLSGRDDDALALEAVRSGAEDYLTKGHCDGYLLVHAMRHAIERHHLHAEIAAMSMHDTLTGLHNRGGFVALAERQLRMAVRANQELSLFYIDLDGLKQLNDGFGHRVGDQALTEAARLLRRTFRNTDIVGRLGGDEFAVLALKTGPTAVDVAIERLQRNLRVRNCAESARFKLSFSIGVAHFDPRQPAGLDQLLGLADRNMYNDKRAKSKG
jgi:diguanylate cyclase (GGDEF)-like protein